MIAAIEQLIVALQTEVFAVFYQQIGPINSNNCEVYQNRSRRERAQSTARLELMRVMMRSFDFN
jgi:hypothetical protein